MSSLPVVAPRRARRARGPTERGPPLRTQAGNYSPLPTFFDAFPSFTRDSSRTPENDFRILQAQEGWEAESTTFIAMRRMFLTALVAETRSPVHAFFVNHTGFLEYDSTASPHLEFLRLASVSTYPVNRIAFHAAFRAEFNGPLDSYFLEYPDFQYNPRGAPMAEFRRLITANGWDAERARRPEYAEEPESIRYNNSRNAFFDAFRNEFDHLFGGDAENFSTWRKLCEILGVEPMPGSMTQCRKATRPLMVNIYDITHHKRTGAPFDFFNTLGDLRSYTVKGELYFPKQRAKESALKFLLRHIFPRVRRE